MTRFGPAGNGALFAAEGYKKTEEIPAFLVRHGLTAFEYQCGRGVRYNAAAAAVLKADAAAAGIRVSVHAPYFISLASAEAEKRDNSLTYIRDSARAVVDMGGDRIVVHPGGLCGLPRPQATALACDTLRRAQRVLDEEGLGQVHICPETMGKINQLGDLQEVLDMCLCDERFLPCVDFGHLNCRTLGGLKGREEYAAVLDRVANALGEQRARRMHVHFSKIAYTQGGESHHLTLADTQFGPEPAPLLQLIAERDWEPVFICESDGTQAEDAATLAEIYRACKETIR
ncbi:MAG: TIM barrel protein [Clostridia bacterium]|nr:TIM barrel protein [Clostridia bacterium]